MRHKPACSCRWSKLAVTWQGPRCWNHRCWLVRGCSAACRQSVGAGCDSRAATRSSITRSGAVARPTQMHGSAPRCGERMARSSMSISSAPPAASTHRPPIPTGTTHVRRWPRAGGRHHPVAAEQTDPPGRHDAGRRRTHAPPLARGSPACARLLSRKRDGPLSVVGVRTDALATRCPFRRRLNGGRVRGGVAGAVLR
jgi:hypothetical protein